MWIRYGCNAIQKVARAGDSRSGNRGNPTSQWRLPLDSNFYIVADTDVDFLQAIKRRDSIILVKGARQMGKTSLARSRVATSSDGGFRSRFLLIFKS
jgi:hypothetical protein